MLLLKQDTIRKRLVNKFLELEFDVGEDKRYKVEAIKDSTVYNKTLKNQLLALYYLVSWKSYWKNESSWESVSAVLHLCKMITNFHKDHAEKLLAMFLSLDFVSPITRQIVKLTAKQKRSRSKFAKQAKKAG